MTKSKVTAEEKLEEEALLGEYKEAFAGGSTNMDFETWRWCKEAFNNPATATTLKLGKT